MQNSQGKRQIVEPRARVFFCLHLAFGILNFGVLDAQQILDRVLARLGTEAITQTDVQSLLELGLITAKSPTEPAAVNQAIERQLVLREVARFPPMEPPADAVEQQLAAMKARVGNRLEEVVRSTGLDETRLRALARDTIRIRDYLEQRFGISTQVSEEEARKYFDDHREEFSRDGKPLSFEDVSAEARRRAASSRVQGAVTQWMQDLRTRSDVVLVMSTSPSGQPATPRAN
jgi:Asp-tRNA(Asn)/Glu-tRNA(Gln) amidotransferase A subunit family amidase